jgi:zinc D-Ala-D-Ala carboxypeptidase
VSAQEIEESADWGMTEREVDAPEGYDPGGDDSLPATEPEPVEPEEGEDTGALDLSELDEEPRGLVSVVTRQRMLVQIGFPIRADGAAGPLTTQAISWFQESWTRSNLGVDGAWGPATEAAAKACIAAGGKVSEHFHLAEFACNHCHWPRANRALVRGLEVLRSNYYPGGLTIVSGYRCAAHNAAIGGARGSQHLYGRAANIPPRVSVYTVRGLHLFGGLEYQPKISGNLCTHVDVRAGGNVTAPSIFAWG